MNNYNPDNQRLFFDDLFNARDLGGMPLTNGKTFKNKLLIRSSSPSIASTLSHDLLVDYGVGTVIDLRSEAEVEHYGNPFAEDGITDFYNVSLFLGDPDSDNDPTMEFLRTHTLGDFYVMMAEELGERIVNILRIILKADNIVLFHCAHGKDRTGVIAAILYLMAEADRNDIILNYKVSYDYARDFLDPLIENRVEDMKHTLRSDAHNMITFLDYLDKTYSNIKEYLNKLGMTDSEYNELKKKITE